MSPARTVKLRKIQGFEHLHKLSSLHFRQEAAGTSRVGSDGHRSGWGEQVEPEPATCSTHTKASQESGVDPRWSSRISSFSFHDVSFRIRLHSDCSIYRNSQSLILAHSCLQSCSPFFNRETRCARDLALSQVGACALGVTDWRHGICDSSINNLSSILSPS